MLPPRDWIDKITACMSRGKDKKVTNRCIKQYETPEGGAVMLSGCTFTKQTKEETLHGSV